MRKSLVVILLVLLCDQLLKVWVKLNMTIGECVGVIGKWFNICFIENNGMAFGWQLSASPWGKIILVSLRIIAVIVLLFFIFRMTRNKTKTGPIVGVSLVTAGAAGNILDCLFYGMIFSKSTVTKVAEIFPAGGGYSSFLQGKVVDMLYFPLFTFPDWMPLLGGEVFFSPIFNVADSAITIGVLYLIVFQWKWLQTVFK